MVRIMYDAHLISSIFIISEEERVCCKLINLVSKLYQKEILVNLKRHVKQIGPKERFPLVLGIEVPPCNYLLQAFCHLVPFILNYTIFLRVCGDIVYILYLLYYHWRLFCLSSSLLS